MATVAVGKAGAKNAGYLAAQMLSIAQPELADKLTAERARNREKIAAQNASVQASLSAS